MPCPNSARERCRTVAFRVTERQAEDLNLRVKASGLNKQDYILAKLMDEEVVVRPSSRLHKAPQGSTRLSKASWATFMLSCSESVLVSP